MNQRILLVFAALLFSSAGFAQTLFTYGEQKVPASEFLRAYYKNNVQTDSNRTSSMEDYLQLYINSRLKIREAYDRGYDTLPLVKTEVENLRSQIIENYMSDPETMNRLAKEAFARSQKDIFAAHIFIPIAGDTAIAYRQAQSVMSRLDKGEDFLTVAQETSGDPAAKTNKGEIGWITVFTLPYPFETALYSLSPGKHSGIIRSNAGYHIFRNTRERKAVGKMKAKQILLAFPPGTDEAAKKLFAKKADSIYKKIIAGADFDKLAMSVSNDYLTSVTGGTMPDFGVGHYEPAFEAKVWALTKNGMVTKPFQTAHGYHIVKRTGTVPVPKDTSDKSFDQELRQRIIQDQRWKSSRDIIVEKITEKGPMKIAPYDMNELALLTDSLIDHRNIGRVISLKPDSPLLTIGDSSFTVNNWVLYAQAFRNSSAGVRRTYPAVMKDFIQTTAYQYYRDNLEKYNEEFRYQMNEFRDGNLFFEIMQQEIWNRAHTDTAELYSLYETNKSKYTWTKSADAVIFFSTDESTAKLLYDQVKKNPASWRTYADAFAEKLVADSSRYEWSQLPGQDKYVPVSGLVTKPIVNTTDGTAAFTYIIKTYPQPTQRTFNEAKGLVINDYQEILEDQWLKKLKQKYPVVIDRKVLAQIQNSK
jgi:peptidyl-prolyl cis-trans isomerase SurA